MIDYESIDQMRQRKMCFVLCVSGKYITRVFRYVFHTDKKGLFETFCTKNVLNYDLNID